MGTLISYDYSSVFPDGHISPINTIHNAHAITAGPGSAKKRRSKSSQACDSQQSVTAVVFQDDHTLISSGSVDGWGSGFYCDLVMPFGGIKLGQHWLGYWLGIVFSNNLLTLEHRETHGCVVSTVATDDLVLKHQAISILSTD